MDQLVGTSTAAGAALRIASWSVHALFMHSWAGNNKAKCKFAALHRLVRDHDVVLLQELHGEEGDLQTLAHAFPHFVALASFGSWAGIGGVAILYRKSIVPRGGTTFWEVIADGALPTSAYWF